MNPRSAIAYHFALVAIIAFIIGVVAGRAHLTYQIRTAAAADASESGTLVIATSDPAAQGARNASRGKVPAPKSNEPEVLKAGLVRKGFHEHVVQNNELQDLITFSVSFKNSDAKDIKAFDGVLTFCDLLDNYILSCSVAMTKPIPTGETIEWHGQLNYIPFLDNHKRLRYENNANIKLAFSPIKVIYADGTTRQFEYNQQ